MNIVHVENYFDPKAGYQINELLYMSKKFNDNVYLITSKDMGRFHKKYDAQLDKEFEVKTGVKIIRLDSFLKISSRIVLKDLNKQIELIKPDILFMHGIGDFRDLDLWKRKKSYKVVRDCHMSWVASQNKFKNLYYIFFRIFFSSIINITTKYEKIYALGIEEHDYLRKIGIKENKIEYMLHGYNGDVMYFDNTERQQIRNSYGFKEDDIVISYIGKFNESKRPDLIFDIITILGTEFLTINKIKLLFIGPKNDMYMNSFNEKLKKISDYIEIVIDNSKPFSELRKYYSASDICIFPKETSLSSIHAQVCKCPVIMEKHISNIERVVNQKNLYEIGNINDATDILKRIIKCKEYKKDENKASILHDREYSNQIKKLSCLVEK